LGETIETAVLEKWLVKTGDFVKKGQPVVVVSTEKADIEIVSPYDGQIVFLHALENHEIAIGTTLATIIQPTPKRFFQKLFTDFWYWVALCIGNIASEIFYIVRLNHAISHHTVEWWVILAVPLQIFIIYVCVLKTNKIYETNRAQK
jgi:hypothetical protein